MTYQITLYDGEWDKTVSEKTVQGLLRQWFPRSRSERRQGSKPYQLTFQPVEISVLVSAELTVYQDSDYFDGDEELVTDKLYRCFYSIGPEYESMVEITRT
jgi:hypothetical protein